MTAPITRRRASGANLASVTPSVPTTMPVADPSGWVRTWDDDFDYDLPEGSLEAGDVLSDRTLRVGSDWHTAFGTTIKLFEDNSPNTNSYGLYYPSKTLSVASGALNIRHHSEVISGTMRGLGAGIRFMQAAGGGQSAHDTGGMIGGRVQFRARATNFVDSGQGFGGVMLYIGAPNQTDQGYPTLDYWPRLGELDFPEGNFADSIHGFHHWADEAYPRYAGDGGQQTVISSTPGGIAAKFWTDWRVCEIEWFPRTSTQPGYVTYRVDGTNYLVTSTKVPWHRLPLSYQSGKSTGSAIPDTSAVTFEIDWLVCWVPAALPGTVLPGTLKT